jgi:DNA-binding NarL/FixJ family response regulator
VNQKLAALRLPLDTRRLTAELRRIVEHFGLSNREALILDAAAYGVPRAHLAEVLEVSENTMKAQVRSLLRKLGEATLDDALWWIRKRVVGLTPRVARRTPAAAPRRGTGAGGRAGRSPRRAPGTPRRPRR